MINTSFELNNLNKSEVAVKNAKAFNEVVEICSALFAGKDTSKYNQKVDAVRSRISKLGEQALAGDSRAVAEINTIVKYIIQPRLLEATKVFNFLGNYHEIGYDEQPRIKTYSYEGLDARLQASGADVGFAGRKWVEYPIVTQTISSGMAIDYRELASGNFAGTVAEEMAQVQTDMNNKGVAYVFDVIKSALKNNTEFKESYKEYDSVPTQTQVDGMINRVRKLGKVGIAGDFSLISGICDWNGYKTVGSTPIPFFNATQVDEIARTGLNGFYKGSALIEIENPYNFAKPLADKSGFDTYYNPNDLWFIAQGVNSPVNIFRRGGITTMTGNDVETGTVKTRFDMELGADVVKGREFEIGLLTKQVIKQD
jgi:hypothetical protein